jgi:hypothetical protein
MKVAMSYYIEVPERRLDMVVVNLDGCPVPITMSLLRLIVDDRILCDKPCFCGSGRLFRKCCINKYGYEPNLKNAQVEKAAFASEPEIRCCHPVGFARCGDHVIESHSVQRAILEKISDVGLDGVRGGKGHVLTMQYTIDDYRNELGRPVGIKDSRVRNSVSGSIFFRFCQPHDSSAFSAIEGNNTFRGDAEQFIQVGYRASCYEDYIARWLATAQSEFISGKQRQGVDIYSHLSGAILPSSMPGIGHIVRQYDLHKVACDQSRFDGMAFELEGKLDVASCGYVVVPKALNAAEGNGAVGFGVVAGAEPNRFHVVFSWLRHDKVARAFVESICNNNKRYIPSILIQFMFAATRNVYFSRGWETNLSVDTRKILRRLSKEVLHRDDFRKIVAKRLIKGLSLRSVTHYPSSAMLFHKKQPLLSRVSWSLPHKSLKDVIPISAVHPDKSKDFAVVCNVAHLMLHFMRISRLCPENVRTAAKERNGFELIASASQAPTSEDFVLSILREFQEPPSKCDWVEAPDQASVSSMGFRCGCALRDLWELCREIGLNDPDVLSEFLASDFVIDEKKVHL